MAITYTWSITSLETQTVGENADTVIGVCWEKRGEDEALRIGMYSSRSDLPTETDADSTFIEFADLTEADVINWVQANMTESYAAKVDASIQEQIDVQTNPINMPSLPWLAE